MGWFPIFRPGSPWVNFLYPIPMLGLSSIPLHRFPILYSYGDKCVDFWNSLSYAHGQHKGWLPFFIFLIIRLSLGQHQCWFPIFEVGPAASGLSGKKVDKGGGKLPTGGLLASGCTPALISIIRMIRLRVVIRGHNLHKNSCRASAERM